MGRNVTDVGLEKKLEQHELKKHAATIHCSNTLSLLQRKITNALLYHAYKELMVKEEHEISVKQLCKLISYQGNNHAAIKSALKELLSTVIEWNIVNDTTGLEDWTASSILASVSLKGPLCYFAYSPRMKQLLHSPSMFGKINLLVQSRFKSSYGLALYENCIRYRGLPYTKWFELDLFRKLMGVPPDKYSIFRDFKRRVLDKSVEEVNTYSELIVEAEVYREGKQVTKIRFALKERAKKTRLGTTNALEESDPMAELKSRLTNQFCLTENQASEVMTEYGSDFIHEKMNLVESSKNFKQGKIQNLAGYFMSALKHNYQSAKSSADQIALVHRGKNLQDEMRDLKWMINQIKEEYALHKENLIDAAIANLCEGEKQPFMERFHLFADESIRTILRLQRKKYSPETVLNSPQVKALLRQFALQELTELQHQIPPIEKFIENFPENYQKAWKRIHEISADVELC
jgi:plasmid replication initiation protein